MVVIKSQKMKMRESYKEDKMAELNLCGYTLIVDEEDIPRIQERTWHLHRSKRHLDLGLIYFLSNASKKYNTPALRLHRYILNYYGDLSVDHINRNTLDCRKENLRIVSQVTNIYNRSIQRNCKSGNRGIFFTNNKWHVSYTYDGNRRQYTFNTKEEAQCVAKYIIESSLCDRDVHNIVETYGEFPEQFSDVAKEALNKFIHRTLRGLRKQGSTIYHGVSRNPSGKYKAAVWSNKKSFHIGTYSTPEEAAHAYDKKAKELLGDKAKLNFPDRIVNGVYT
jgi:hypothetical protein